MKENSTFDIPGPKLKPAALLWDESFLWGVMAYKALDACGLPYDLIRADDIRQGRLKEYALLFVPGGWASNKVKTLGDSGVEAIKQFVRSGGSYLGFCGGAGLATEDGIGLLPVRRRSTQDRVPSFSGRIQVKTSEHSLWQGISDPIFHAWWPSQFVAGEGVSVLATYSEAMPDAFSSDVNVGDAERVGGWAELERLYQINLDPRRLLHEPAVIEGSFGKGKVLLSLLHFDTLDDRNGMLLLKNLWTYLVPYKGNESRRTVLGSRNVRLLNFDPLFNDIEAAINDLISLGQRNFLWFWRNPMLLQWRRGVRGLEYCTLSIMVREIADHLKQQDGDQVAAHLEQSLARVKSLLLPFVDQAKLLLVRERLAMQRTHITYERCDDLAIKKLREELFSRAKSHGGLFKEILDEIDRLLYRVLIGRCHGHGSA